MDHAHQPYPRPHNHGGVACCALLCAIGLLLSWTPALAHHGGLGIEGDLVQWALKVDQWQDEGIAQGHRIKFLSYPRQPVIGNGTRLVFEIQSTATGQYVSGLTAELEVRAPDGRRIAGRKRSEDGGSERPGLLDDGGSENRCRQGGVQG